MKTHTDLENLILRCLYEHGRPEELSTLGEEFPELRSHDGTLVERTLMDLGKQRLVYVGGPRRPFHFSLTDRGKQRAGKLVVDPDSFRGQLQQLINSHSMENNSNTPDFILANYLQRCLTAFDEAVTSREAWFGRLGTTIAADPKTARQLDGGG